MRISLVVVSFSVIAMSSYGFDVDGPAICQQLRNLEFTFAQVGNNEKLDLLVSADKAARTLLGIASGSRGDSRELEACALYGIAFVATQRHDFDESERNLVKALELDPANINATRLLAGALSKRNRPGDMLKVLYHYGRIAAYDGPGSADPEQRRRFIDTVLPKIYARCGGTDPKGLIKLLNVARLSALPPPDFSIQYLNTP